MICIEKIVPREEVVLWHIYPKLPKYFSTIEALAIQSKLGRHNALLLGLYRLPKATGKDYYLRLENELHDLISWASMQREPSLSSLSECQKMHQAHLRFPRGSKASCTDWGFRLTSWRHFHVTGQHFSTKPPEFHKQQPNSHL